MKSIRTIAGSLALLLVAALSQSAIAQKITRKLTLEESIGIARKQSPDALNAKQAFITSYWEYRSFTASNLPALTLKSTLPKLDQSMSPYLNPDGSISYVSVKNISANANLALSQKIGITGGEVSVNSYLGAIYNADGSTQYPYLSNPVNITFNQPIFTYNKYRWDRKIKPLKYSQAKRKFIEDNEQIALTATNYFFTLLQAQIEKAIAQTNLKNYDTLYRIARGRFELGKIAENDLLQLRLQFLKAQAAVENADLSVDNAQFQFKSYLRLQDSTWVELLPPGDIRFMRIDPQKAVELAVQNSTTSLDFRKRLLEAARDVNEAKMTGRFDANLGATIGLQQSGATIKQAYINPVDQRQVALDITIPIVDWGVAHGQIKMAQSQEDIVKNNVEQEIIDFKRNVYLKAVQFNMQKNQINIAATSDTVAGKSYDVIKGRYLIGKINSILDLYNAQMETDNSRKNYYYALQVYWKSYYEIRKLTLFDFENNIDLPFNPPAYR